MDSINQLLASLVRPETNLKAITDHDLKRAIDAAANELIRRGWNVRMSSGYGVDVMRSTKL